MRVEHRSGKVHRPKTDILPSVLALKPQLGSWSNMLNFLQLTQPSKILYHVKVTSKSDYTVVVFKLHAIFLFNKYRQGQRWGSMSPKFSHFQPSSVYHSITPSYINISSAVFHFFGHGQWTHRHGKTKNIYVAEHGSRADK